MMSGKGLVLSSVGDDKSGVEDFLPEGMMSPGCLHREYFWNSNESETVNCYIMP